MSVVGAQALVSLYLTRFSPLYYLLSDQSVKHEVYDEKEDAIRVPSEIFLRVPSRKDYPDYYKIIAKPIDLKTIHEVFQTRFQERKIEGST